jgi:hypothetical protein
MAIGACLAGGLVLSAAMTFGPSLGSPSSTPSTAHFDEAALSDSQVSFPMPTTTPNPAVAMPSATPTAESLVPVATSASAEAAASTSPSPSSIAPEQLRAEVADPLPEPSRSAQLHSTPSPAGSKTETTSGRPLQSPRPAVPAAVPVPLNGWAPNRLHVGANDVSVPKMSTSAKVTVTIMCSPSAACQMSGSSLMIDPSASQVAVTWRSPGNRRSKAWSTSRTLSAIGAL